MRFPVLAFLLAFLMLGAVSFASVEIDYCTEMNVSGETYLLTADIVPDENWSGNCLVSSGNITLDCQGHQISLGDAIEGDYAVFEEGGVGYLEVRNCVFTEWAYGIALFDMADFGCIAVNNTFYSEYGGILWQDANGCIAANNTFTDVNYAVHIGTGCENSIVTGSVFTNSNPALAITAVYFPDAFDYSSSLLYNNLFNGTWVFCEDGVGDDDYVGNWNTTRQNGERIYSDGIEIGGNYWTNGTNNGYSDACTDSDNDGFCDDPYTVSGLGYPYCNFTDYLPLSMDYETPTTTTTSTTTTTTTSTTTTTTSTTTTVPTTTTTTVSTTTTTMFMTPMRQTPLGNMAVNIVIIVVALGSILYIFSIVLNPVSDPKSWLKLLITAVVLMLIVLSLISLW